MKFRIHRNQKSENYASAAEKFIHHAAKSGAAAVLLAMTLLMFSSAAVNAAEETEKFTASTDMQYYRKISELVENESDYIEKSIKNSCYESCRLIVKSSDGNIDTSSLSGLACAIENNADDEESGFISILQFETSSQASAAAVKLRAAPNVTDSGWREPSARNFRASVTEF